MGTKRLTVLSDPLAHRFADSLVLILGLDLIAGLVDLVEINIESLHFSLFRRTGFSYPSFSFWAQLSCSIGAICI